MRRHRSRAACSLILFAVAFAALPPRVGGARGQATAATEDVRALVAAAQAARDKRDYPAYLETIRNASALRPTHPVILYRLAGAYALTSQPREAAAALEALARLAVYRDPSSDGDFAAVIKDPAVRHAISALEGVKQQRIGSGTPAFTIPDPAFVPEGIAFDRATGTFFVSSQFERKIVAIDRRGTIRNFIDEGQDGIWMVFGIAVDPARRWLWAVSSAEPVMKGFEKADENRAGLFAFDLSTGKLVKKFVAEPAEPRHYYDDLVVAPDGRVFLSDAGTGIVYVLPAGAEKLDILVGPGTIQGPNGLALAPDGRRLFVSDYAGFIFRIDTQTGGVARLPQPGNAVIYGIDGLSWHASGLIGIQNGVDPPRVIRLRLSPTGSEIASVDILEMNNPLFEEPTLGVVAGDDFYCVANSHGGAMRRSPESVRQAALSPPAVLKIHLQ